jgi:hypothetical protein
MAVAEDAFDGDEWYQDEVHDYVYVADEAWDYEDPDGMFHF